MRNIGHEAVLVPLHRQTRKRCWSYLEYVYRIPMGRVTAENRTQSISNSHKEWVWVWWNLICILQSRRELYPKKTEWVGGHVGDTNWWPNGVWDWMRRRKCDKPGGHYHSTRPTTGISIHQTHTRIDKQPLYQKKAKEHKKRTRDQWKNLIKPKLR